MEWRTGLEIEANNCVQATPDYGLLFIVAQVSGAPDAGRCRPPVSTRLNTIVTCCICAFLAGCGAASVQPRVAGNLSSNDVVLIERAVHEDVVRRLGSASGHPIKSIEPTTNNSYQIEKSLNWRGGQPAPDQTRTNAAVDVWYADQHARWGEAGYTLERTTNGWKIISELFR